MEKQSLWNRVTRALSFAEDPFLRQQTQNQPSAVSITHDEPIGSSGVQNFGGYYQEEYLSSLQGRQRADQFDKMRRSDPKLKMLLSAVKNPIKSATWTFKPADDSDQAKFQAEFMEHILFKGTDKSWTGFLHEVLSFIDFGFAPFEIQDKVVTGHPKFGTYNGIASLGWRSPRTIERWNLDKQTGKLVSISQYAFGDIQRLVDIPAPYLLLFVMDKEGDSYEGVSWLRPCYGAWKRKDHHLKQEAIGIEKYATPTPFMEVPENKENSAQFANAKKVLEKYVTHQQQYITLPAGWKIDFVKNEFDAEKIRSAINADNIEMVHGFLANFLELGSNTSSGGYALSFDLSDFFIGGIEYVAKLICEDINRCIVKRYIDLNFGPQDAYPELTFDNISDKAGKEFAEVMKLLTDNKIIVPDDSLEDEVRKKYNLPAKSDQGQRQVNQPGQSAPAPAAPAIAPKFSESIRLAEPRKQIKEQGAALQDVMSEGLEDISEDLVNQLMSKYRSLTPANRLDAVRQVNPKGLQDYQASVLAQLASIATDALAQARKEVPAAKNVKLAEFDDLPPDIQKIIRARSQLLVGTQIADLQKTIYFTYQSSVGSTDSESLVQSDLSQAADEYLNSGSISSGALTIASQTVNEARSAFFLEPDVADEIESYTFVNGDPQSPICQDLSGTVFSKDDPNVDRYWPPLHFNCKSYIVPNLKQNKGNPPLTEGGLQPSKAELNKYVQLSEKHCCGHTIKLAEGFVVQSALVSKKIAKTVAEAQAILAQYQVPTDKPSELDNDFKFTVIDQSLIEPATLSSFEPVEGVRVYVGLAKPPAV